MPLSRPSTLHRFLNWQQASSAALLCVLALALPASAIGAEAEGPSKQEIEARHTRLGGIGQALGDGKANQALAAADELIALYDADNRKPDVDVFCASSPAESLLYLLQATAAKRNAVVLDPTWAQALYFRGYALVELKKQTEARVALQRAVDLSPSNSMYLGELAQLLAQYGEADRALAMFKRAEEAAQTYTPEANRDHDIARALRGQGYALVELRRYDEAESAYRAVLKMRPGDKLATNELLYIGMQRTAAAAAGAASAPH